MPVTQNQRTIVTTHLKCDQCGLIYSFDEDSTQGPEEVPEGAVRFLAIVRLGGAFGLPANTPLKVAVCSKFCALEFFKTYEAARKPTKEELESLKANATQSTKNE